MCIQLSIVYMSDLLHSNAIPHIHWINIVILFVFVTFYCGPTRYNVHLIALIRACGMINLNVHKH